MIYLPCGFVKSKFSDIIFNVNKNKDERSFIQKANVV